MPPEDIGLYMMGWGITVPEVLIGRVIDTEEGNGLDTPGLVEGFDAYLCSDGPSLVDSVLDPRSPPDPDVLHIPGTSVPFLGSGKAMGSFSSFLIDFFFLLR